jgi:dipeptidyl aminopeptidase/acylaminoacyl peptidase
MAVGISDRVSKLGTTDIPNETYLVHNLRWPWQDWDGFRERSPLYHVESARTPILILHGKDDTRVHPSQSLELYRYLKLIDRAPVRLVLYPGEGHGNRKAAARLDFTLRQVRWFEHYLLGPGGAPPPYEVPEELECVRQDEDEDQDEAEQEDGP